MKKVLTGFMMLSLLIGTGLLVEAKTTYRVAPGDSLYLIARRYGTSVNDLMRENGLHGSAIYPGQTLTVSAAGSADGYQVKSGDSLFLIAKRYGISVDSLKRANGLAGNSIYPGQRLSIPKNSGGPGQSGSWAYTVRPGDSLYLVAKKCGVTLDALRRTNNIWSNTIYAGQVIKIPGSTGGQSPSGSPGGVSQADLELLARLVTAEAGGEPYSGQVAVAASVLNRVRDSKYPNSVSGVVYQYSDGAYQYSPVLDGRINQPATSSAIAAVRDALNGWDPSYGATGFYNPAKTRNSWVRSRPVTTVIGGHVFFKH